MKSAKRLKSIIYICIAAALILVIATGIFIEEINAKNVTKVLSVSEAQDVVDDAFSSLPKTTAVGAKNIIEKSTITVNSVKKGNEKNLLLSCEYSSYNVAEVVEKNKDEIMATVYKNCEEKEKQGIMTNATLIRLDITNQISEYVKTAKKVSGKITLSIYEIKPGNYVLHLEDKIVDKCTGGLLTASKAIKDIKTVTVENETIDISKKNTLRTGVSDCFALKNYDNKKPNTGSILSNFFNTLGDDLHNNFIKDGRWKYLWNGLLITLAMTAISAIIGILLGFVVAIIRCTHDTVGSLKIPNAICKIYLSIIRGTPLMIQLLIIYFVILLPIGVAKFPSAVLCFGLNSGAYVAEIVRGGIMSVDKGQREAGRSLGFNYTATMYHIIVPQAFKAVLPSLANEFITLLKESSVAFYIGVADLTQGGIKIRSITYSNFIPLIAVALIYFILVVILTRLVGMLEKRLRKSDH